MSAVPESFLGPAANDTDAQETREWLDALDGRHRHRRASAPTSCSNADRGGAPAGIDTPFSANTPTSTPSSPSDEERSPGNLELEGRLRAYMRWNAMAMVVKANRLTPTTAVTWAATSARSSRWRTCSAAGFNHFWHADEPEGHGGDLLYIQGHSAPGIYARAFMEGRLTEEQMLNFRQEVGGKGLSSYPHPKLMPDFWQFPTCRWAWAR
jgi:pyruvate dehydrogenase E1 component